MEMIDVLTHSKEDEPTGVFPIFKISPLNFIHQC